MNILITGAKGFLGKELTKYLSKNYNVIAADRNILNPAKYESVKSFFTNNKIDIVIHTAIKGGKRGQKENIEDFYENLLMFNNLVEHSMHYKKLINFGSGAEFDRSTDINNAVEDQVLLSTPKDYYGLSKNLITRKICKLNNNTYNLRLFGCFGVEEEPQRLLRATFNNISQNKNPIILGDKFMDYFFVEDVARVVEFVINNEDIEYKDINLSYNKKFKLSNLVYKVKDLMHSNCEVEIQNSALKNFSYTGDPRRLQTLKIDLVGLEAGIKTCIEQWKEKNNVDFKK